MNKHNRKQLAFQALTEINIIQQLATTEFNRCLPEGLHVSHFGVINHLSRMDEECTPLSIAQAFQVTKATMTNTLSKLSARGFITIKANPQDGRSKLVSLTAKGRKFQDRAVASLEPSMEQMDEALNLEKIIATLPALQELKQFLNENRSVIKSNAA